MTYAEREHELAMSVLVDPESSPEDRAAARARLREAGAPPVADEESYENRLTPAELTEWLRLGAKLNGEPG